MSHDGRRIYVKESADGSLNPEDNSRNVSKHLSSEKSERQLEEQLFQSQRLETLGTLVGGIAHDFNNILNVITGHVSLMERWRTDPERFRRSYEAVKKATERGGSIARQLLTFARKVDVTAGPVMVGDVVKEIVTLLKVAFPEKISFNVEIEESIPAITADSNQIHQALVNLCMNARDAMAEGGTISIIARSAAHGHVSRHFLEAKADRYIQLTVSDTGSGMDDKTLHHIFEPFFTTKPEGRGTGLGLSVVYGIIKAHNGFIDVESKVGKGTKFSLYFPVLAFPAKSLAKEVTVMDSPAGKDEVLLVIEDEESLRDFLKMILEESGYRVLAAPDGIRGLQTYRDHMEEIDLVLLDMGLPEMGGGEVLKELVKLNSKVKVIAASGYIEPEVKIDAYEIGASEFLSKPYQTNELLGKVRSVLEGKARRHI